MNGELKGHKLAILGGDDREIVLVEELAALGADVKVVGYEECRDLKGVTKVSSIEEALGEAQGVIFPMVGTDERAVIRAVYHQSPLRLEKSHLALLQPNTTVTIGVAREFLRQWCRELRLNLIEIAEMDELAILNSVPSAEGAIQIAMEQTPITIHGSRSVVVGFGRVGQTIAWMLKGIGAHVTVAARKAGDMARAMTLGYQVVDYSELGPTLAVSDIVFNTVPAMVLTEPILTSTASTCLIIDLATQPGGTDFQAAAKLGIKAILAPGLPGKVAPVTAGRILTQVLPKLFLEHTVAKDS